MTFLSLVCLIACAPTPLQSGAWTTIRTPVGVTVSCPVDLGKAEVTTDKDPKSTTDWYTPKVWDDCQLFVEREDFPSDEDAKDPLAQRIGDAVFGEVELGDDKVARISYGLQEGWPTMDIEGKLKDGHSFWYRISRTKSQHFIVGFTATTLPDRAVIKRLLDSYKLPADAGAGKLTKWWPDGSKCDLTDAHVEVWSPIPFKRVDDDPDFSVDGGKAVQFDATFGYSSYNVTMVEFADSIDGKIDDDAVDELIKQSIGHEEPDTIKMGEFKTVQVGDLKGRSVTYTDESIECRIDILVRDNRMYRICTSGVRGMLDSEDMKKFYASIVVK